MLVSKFDSSENSLLFSPKVVAMLEQLKALNLANLELGKYSFEGIDEDDAFFIVMEYQTAKQSSVGPEFHRKYTDIQLLVSGEEQFGWVRVSDSELADLDSKYQYDAERDICFIKEQELPLEINQMKPGHFYLFTPQTIHMPNLAIGEPSAVRKVVVKLKTELLNR